MPRMPSIAPRLANPPYRRLRSSSEESVEGDDDRHASLPASFLRNIRLEHFSGEHGQDFTEWIEQFEVHIETNQIARGARALALRAYLRGSASRQVHRLPDATKRNYMQLVEFLHAQYDTENSKLKAKSISQLVQGPKQTVSEYIRLVQDQVNIAYADADISTRERIAMGQILNGVRKDYLEAVPQAVTTDTLEEMRKLLMSKELAHRITSGKPIPPPRTRNRRRMERLALEPAETDEAESVVTDYRLNQLSEEDLNQVQQLIKGTHTDVMNTVSQYAEGFEDKFRLLASRIAQVELSANKPQYRNNYSDNRGTKPAPNMFANMICFFCGKQGHGTRYCKERLRREGPNPKDFSAQARPSGAIPGPKISVLEAQEYLSYLANQELEDEPVVSEVESEPEEMTYHMNVLTVEGCDTDEDTDEIPPLTFEAVSDIQEKLQEENKRTMWRTMPWFILFNLIFVWLMSNIIMYVPSAEAINPEVRDKFGMSAQDYAKLDMELRRRCAHVGLLYNRPLDLMNVADKVSSAHMSQLNKELAKHKDVKRLGRLIEKAEANNLTIADFAKVMSLILTNCDAEKVPIDKQMAFERYRTRCIENMYPSLRKLTRFVTLKDAEQLNLEIKGYKVVRDLDYYVRKAANTGLHARDAVEVMDLILKNCTEWESPKVRYKRGASLPFEFLDRNQSYPGIREKQAAAFTARNDVVEDNGDNDQKSEPTLTTLFGQHVKALGAITNLGLGAVALPTGLAIVSSSKIYVPLIREMILPHWANLHKSKPQFDHKVACKGLGESCERVLNPNASEAECPSTDRVVANYHRVVHEFRAQYEGVTNPYFYSQMMATFCDQNTLLCVEGMDPKSSSGRQSRSRKKRFVGLIASAMIGITGMGLGVANQLQVQQLSSQMERLYKAMKLQNEVMRSFKEGMIKLSANQEEIRQYITEGFFDVYEVIEKLRCMQKQELYDLAEEHGLQLFRNYLQDNLDAIATATSTGRVSPRLLGVKELDTILAENPSTAHSLIRREPSLVYQYGKLFPVKLDFEALSFGYILEIPTPRPQDVYPLYHIQNVGFMRLPSEVVYKAPFPMHAIVDRDNELLPLDEDLCTPRPGLMYCEVGASAKHQAGTACLESFFKERCENCEEQNKRCIREIVAEPKEASVTRVITTMAGILIRAPKDEVVAYEQNPHAHHGAKGKLIPRNHFGTYWFEHSKYKLITVGKQAYTAIGQTVHVTRVIVPKPFELPEDDMPEFPVHTIEALKELKFKLDKSDTFIREIEVPEWMNDYWPHMSVGMALFLAAILSCALFFICKCICFRNNEWCNKHIWPSLRPYRKWDFEDYRNWIVDQHHRRRAKKRDPMSEVPQPMPSFANSDDDEDTVFAQGARITGRGPIRAPIFSSSGDLPSYSLLSQKESSESGLGTLSTGLGGSGLGHVSALSGDHASGSQERKSPISNLSQFHVPPVTSTPRAPILTPSKSQKTKKISVLMIDSPEDDLVESDKPTEPVIWATTKVTVPRSAGSGRSGKLTLGFVLGYHMHKVNVLCDSGADVSVVSRALVERAGGTIEPLGVDEPRVRMCDDGQYLAMAGKVQGILYLAGHSYPFRFFVPKSRWEHKQYDIIMGHDLMQRIGELRISYKNKRLMLIDDRTKAKFIFKLKGRRAVITTDGPPMVALRTRPESRECFHRPRKYLYCECFKGR
jgi:hypothetical protein